MKDLVVRNAGLIRIAVWIFFIVSFVILYFFFTRRTRETKKIQAKAKQEYNDKKEKYTYLKPGVFDDMERNDVFAAAIFHCLRKEDEDFDHYFDFMNESERIVFGIYQMTLLFEGAGASLHSFFLSPTTKVFVPMVVDMYEKVGSHELAELMKAARRFAEIIENEEEDDDDDMGDYSRYNFSDFTNEFMTLVSTTNLHDKIVDFILAHKEDFYDEIEESGDVLNEGISE